MNSTSIYFRTVGEEGETPSQHFNNNRQRAPVRSYRCQTNLDYLQQPSSQVSYIPTLHFGYPLDLSDLWRKLDIIVGNVVFVGILLSETSFSSEYLVEYRPVVFPSSCSGKIDEKDGLHLSTEKEFYPELIQRKNEYVKQNDVDISWSSGIFEFSLFSFTYRGRYHTSRNERLIGRSSYSLMNRLYENSARRLLEKSILATLFDLRGNLFSKIPYNNPAFPDRLCLFTIYYQFLYLSNYSSP